jgi:hypothetical protein
MPVDPNPPPPPAGAAATLSAVTGAIRKAAHQTGASFDYLLATAKVESDLDPGLSMRSSSATGLFQFIEQTWLAVMKQAGNALGFGRYADAITETSSGRYEVTDPAMRREIMQLRKDPGANAALGAAFTEQNAAVLADRLGRRPTDGELYIAHFLGPHAAVKLIGAAASNPTADAAQMFPAAARANRPIFYDSQGHARSVAGVYQELVRRYQVARASPTPGTTAAAAAAAGDQAPDPAAVTEVLAAASAQPAAAQPPDRSEDDGPLFQSLFHTGAPRGAVSPAVAALWGARPTLRGDAGEGSVATAFAPTANDQAVAGTPLDLFQDMPPRVRGLFDAKD